MEAAEAEIFRLQRENERLKSQIRDGNARFDATVEVVVAERWREWQEWRADDMGEHCPSCGEVSAKTLMCRACTLEQNERDSLAAAAPAPQAKVCPECGGDGVTVVGWDEDGYENIEGPCSRCAADAPATEEEPCHGVAQNWCDVHGQVSWTHDGCEEIHESAIERDDCSQSRKWQESDAPATEVQG